MSRSRDRLALSATRISHPLAVYDLRTDQLSCKQCGSRVDPLLWRAHVAKHDNEGVEPAIEDTQSPVSEKRKLVDHDGEQESDEDEGRRGGEKRLRRSTSAESNHRMPLVLPKPKGQAADSALDQSGVIDMDKEWAAFQAEIRSVEADTVVSAIPTPLQPPPVDEPPAALASNPSPAFEPIQNGTDLAERLKRLKQRAAALRSEQSKS